MAMSDIDLSDLIGEAKEHQRQQKLDAQRRAWNPTALVLVETAVTCTSCGHTDYCGTGVLVRYKRHRKDGVEEIHETDSPYRLEAFADLPRQVRHRSTSTRACRHCFMTGDITHMLPYVEKLRLRHDGNQAAQELDINLAELEDDDE